MWIWMDLYWTPNSNMERSLDFIFVKWFSVVFLIANQRWIMIYSVLIVLLDKIWNFFFFFLNGWALEFGHWYFFKASNWAFVHKVWNLQKLSTDLPNTASTHSFASLSTKNAWEIQAWSDFQSPYNSSCFGTEGSKESICLSQACTIEPVCSLATTAIFAKLPEKAPSTLSLIPFFP